MATGSPSPPPRERRRSPSEDDGDDDRSSRRDRHSGRDRIRRRGEPRSPDDGRSDRKSRHTHSRRHRDRDSVGPSDEERASRRRRKDRSRDRQHRSRSRSRRRTHRSRSRDERKRRHEGRSTSPRRPHGPERRRERSGSARRPRRTKHDGSRSRSPRRRKPSASASPARKRSNRPLASQEAAYLGEGSASGEVAPPVEKQKPNFNQTGLLARESNTVAGTNIVLKYNEPPDARKPPGRDGWRLYIFKGPDLLQTVELGARSCWLIGREAAVADLPVEHPSTSKQHAVLQFRHTTRANEFGDKDARVRPYLMDLESSNGTLLNGEKVEATRFVEVLDKDVIKLGLSEREYVLVLPPADG